MDMEVYAMSKRTKIAVLMGAVAAVISAVVLIVLFWDKLLEKLPCRCFCREDDYEIYPEEPTDDVISYQDEELEDYADLSQQSAE